MYKMPCGCEFPILNAKIKDYDGLPSIYIDYENIKLDCPITWQLFYEGRTKGVFQLEKSLGQSWSKKVKPIDIEEVAALVSILRPGTLKAIVDGKNMSQHFVDRKDGLEPYDIDPPIIKDVLDPSYGVIIYQEQAMEISKKIAGFNLKQADTLRKSMGKKDAELMAKVRKDFIKCAEEIKIVSVEQANEIFDIIEKSNRYSFNKSHAVAYGLTAYWTAYLKAHFPLHFFTSWLKFSENKQNELEEVALLINDAKSFRIKTRAPSIIDSKETFSIKNKEIITGLSNIAKIGTNKAIKILSSVKNLETTLKKEIKDFTWNEILIYLSPLIDSASFINLCATGAFDFVGIYRTQMMFEYNKIQSLTGKNELPWLQQNINKYPNLADAIAALVETKSVSSGRKDKVNSLAISLKNPPSKIADTEMFIAESEKQLIGTSLTCSKLDGLNLTGCNCNCEEFREKQLTTYMIGCQIDKVNEYIPKGGKIAGQKMLYLTLSDSYGTIEAVMFPREAKENELVIFEGNTIIAIGKKSDRGSLTINKIRQI